MSTIITKTVNSGDRGLSSNRRPRAKKNKTANDVKTVQLINQVLAKKEMRLKDRLSYNDTPIYALGNTTSVLFSLLSAMPQGSGQEGRTGDTVRLIAIEYTFQFSYNFSASLLSQDNFDWNRFGFFIWKENTATVTPTTTGIWQVAPSSAFTVSPWNFETRDTYSVIMDDRAFVAGYFNSLGTVTVPTSNSSVIFSGVKKLGGRPVRYNPAVTTGTGHLYAFNFSDSGIAPHPMMNAYFRLIYERIV